MTTRHARHRGTHDAAHEGTDTGTHHALPATTHDRMDPMLRHDDSGRASVPRRRAARGYALLSVLIAVSVVAAFVAGYGRHVVIDGRWSLSSPFVMAPREACQSGMSLARQSLVAGQPLVAGTVAAGQGLAQVAIEEQPGGQQLIEVTALVSGGIGARQVLELQIQASAAAAPSDPASLPRLSADTLEALAAGGVVPPTWIEGHQSFVGAELNGVIALQPGAVLELSDVVVTGCIVSASVLGDEPPGPFDEATAPRLVLAGNVRIDATGSLAGLAIALPDGLVLSGTGDARLQIHGDVVAHAVELSHPGALEGHVSSVVPAQLHPGLDRLGFERRPPDWAGNLDLGVTREPVLMAFVPDHSSLAELAPIIDYWK